MSPVLEQPKVDKPQDLEGIVTECVQTLSEDLRTHGIVLDAMILDPIPPLHFDPEVIEMLLTAVLDSRAGAIPAGGRLSVSLATSGECVHISVSDTGWGVPLEAIPQLFGRPEGLRRQPRLGSARFQQILESQSGEFVTDRQPGHGSTMTLSFPVSPVSPLQ